MNGSYETGYVALKTYHISENWFNIVTCNRISNFIFISSFISNIICFNLFAETPSFLLEKNALLLLPFSFSKTLQKY